MDKILVTGGTGFVGHWLSGTRPEALYIGRAEYILEDWYKTNWNFIVHAAPVAPNRVLECARRNSARVLYISSGIVYHPENDIEYRQNKIKWEQECLASGVDVVIARLFTFYGAWLDDNKAISRFTKAARENQPICIWGDGNTIRTYMYGSEMARWLWAILFNGECWQAYDVGSDTPVTMLELARRVKAENHSSSEIILRNSPDPVPVYIPPNTAKTKALLRQSGFECSACVPASENIWIGGETWLRKS